MRKYTLVVVVALVAWGVGPAGAQAPPGAVVTPVPGAWTPRVIATSRPVTETVQANPVAVQPVKPHPADAPPTARTAPEPLTLVSESAPHKAAPPAGPCLVVERVAPAVVPSGKPLVYEIVVRNVGAVEAQRVQVEEQLPPGAAVTGAEPQPEQRGAVLVWNLGSLAAGAERRLRVSLQPAAEGDLTATATVTCATTNTLRARVAGSGVSLVVTSPPPAQPGQKVTFQFRITNNTGTPVRGQLLKVQLAAGLRHPLGSKVEAPLPTLSPGETKPVRLEVATVSAGRQVLKASVGPPGPDQGGVEAAVEVTEAAPPAAPAPPAPLPPVLPSPSPAGPDLVPLPPPEAPRQQSRAAPPAGGAVTLDVAEADQALEVGRETTYEIRVLNQDAEPSRDVLVRAVVPDEMTFVGADGPTASRVQGREVAFEPLASLGARGQAVYRVRVRALKPGDGRFTARLQCAALARPTSQEVTTCVYSGERAAGERGER